MSGDVILPEHWANTKDCFYTEFWSFLKVELGANLKQANTVAYDPWCCMLITKWLHPCDTHNTGLWAIAQANQRGISGIFYRNETPQRNLVRQVMIFVGPAKLSPHENQLAPQRKTDFLMSRGGKSKEKVEFRWTSNTKLCQKFRKICPTKLDLMILAEEFRFVLIRSGLTPQVIGRAKNKNAHRNCQCEREKTVSIIWGIVVAYATRLLPCTNHQLALKLTPFMIKSVSRPCRRDPIHAQFF